MHYYQFHIGDYRGATSHLSNEEDLAYRRLLEMYYDIEGPIPLDLSFVSRRVRVGLEIIQIVLEDFFTLTDQGWVNKRAEKEILEYQAKKDGASRAGKVSAERRANTKATTVQRPSNDCSTTVQPTINQEPLTINHEPVTNISTKTRLRAVVCPEGVSPQVWDDYLAVRKAKRSPVTATAIAGLEREAVQAGWSLNQALAECAARGWVGFKAEWVRENKNLREALDDSRLKSMDIVNRTMRRVQSVEPDRDGSAMVEIEHQIRRGLE